MTVIEQADSTIDVTGKFRHYKKWNFDDKIRFHFKFFYGEVRKSEIEIKKEGFESYVTLGLAHLLYSIFDGFSINTGTVDEVIEQIALWPTESWTQAAQKIVVLIALEAYRPYMPSWSSPVSAPWIPPVASPPSAVRDFRGGGSESAPVPPVTVYDCGVLMCQCNGEEDCEDMFE